MQNLKLKYVSYTITMQEVPDEISLIINISGCQHRCNECHSQYLWDYSGSYLYEDISKIIDGYKGLFTCVCFMGGDQNIEELIEINSYCKLLGYKTCLYSGSDTDDLLTYKYFDYMKIGSYNVKLGGLDSLMTNQRMYKLQNNSYKDITNRFLKQV